MPSLAQIRLPAPVDLFWTTENYHDFHNNGGDIAALNKAVFDNLKAGGIFFVEDHSAAKGAGLAATSTLHRMDEDVAKAELQAAGFRLDGESNLLRNPADNRVGRNAELGSFRFRPVRAAHAQAWAEFVASGSLPPPLARGR